MNFHFIESIIPFIYMRIRRILTLLVKSSEFYDLKIKISYLMFKLTRVEMPFIKV